MVINMIVGSGILILVILLIRRIFWKKCSPNVIYFLWIFVAFRILLPVNIPLEVSGYPLAKTFVMDFDIESGLEENSPGEDNRGSNIKEVKEESGLDVVVKSVIAIQDRAKHNLPVYAYGICKIFVLCSLVGGSFQENLETTGFDYFAEDNLPELAEEKNTVEQIKMCFDAHRAGDTWKTYFD